ncbi:MAG: protein translocase subunit SecD [Streptosporangiaceae bacterium]
MAPPKNSSNARSARRGSAARQNAGPPSHPLRHLVALAILIVVMLGGVLGGAYAFSPGQWHKAFKVALGLDLSSGTSVTLKAYPLTNKNKTPTKSEINTAIGILISRVNGQGFSGATVVPEGTDNIVVSIPHKSAEQVAPLLQSAVLRFRQVLLTAPGFPVPVSTAPTPTPSPSASPGAKVSASPTPSASPSASSKASASPSPSASTSASPSPSASPAGAAASPAPSATPSVKTQLPTAAQAQGNAALVTSKAVLNDFNKLNCHDKNWQSKIYGTDPANWDNPNAQIVACDSQGQKYVLDVAKVLGTNLTSVAAQLNQQNQWVVTFNLDSKGATAFGNLTTSMYQKYYNPTTQQATSVLDEFAIVLDGKVVSAPQIQSPITAGNGQITGPGTTGFTSGAANQLAAVLKYGAVPLAFQKLSVQSVSAQLGSSQLTAGLIAAGIGLLLVVVYSFLYYRGLGVVSVSSLVIAALLSWLAVVLLSKYEGFTLDLAGVAGLIVAIGITADSFVVYFERLRDEVREGRSLRAAVERGWERARRTIIVSDTVSFLAALLLYIFAIGSVRGFAFTLGLTTLIDIVVVFLFTKPMVTLLARTEFYGGGHKLSGLDPARLGAKSPWRGSRSRAPRPATGGASAATASRTTPKEA